MTPYTIQLIYSSHERLEKHLREIRHCASYQQQRAADLQARLEVGSKNYAEQRPYDLLRLITQHMTPDELRTILERAAPPEEPRIKPETDNDSLYRGVMLDLKKKHRARHSNKP
jgi:hypothetical protein